MLEALLASTFQKVRQQLPAAFIQYTVLLAAISYSVKCAVRHLQSDTFE